jgi:DNA modification methylase
MQNAEKRSANHDPSSASEPGLPIGGCVAPASAVDIGPLRSIGDVLRTLHDGTYPLPHLYDRVRRTLGDEIAHNNGLEPSTPRHPCDPKWRQRVRCWLANQQRAGNAWPVKRAVWAIDRRGGQPCHFLLISADGRLEEVELQVRDAVALLEDLQEPVDAVITDPPWGLRWDDAGSRHHYARDHSKVLDGYIDVSAGGYLDFSRSWITAAAGVLRPGGQLVIVTGPQAAAHVQVAAEEQGLTWISSIAAIREFTAPSQRRPTPAHWTITVMCRGTRRHPQRVFNPPTDQRRSKTGGLYPLDVWVDNGRADRPGLLRYATMLPPRLTQRMVLTFTDPGQHVCDPMAGGGEVVNACQLLGRRITAGDLNPHAIAFTAARLLREQIWPAQLAPGLFARAA